MSALNKFDTRIILWLLFFVQIFLIGIFLGFGSIFYPNGCAGDCTTSINAYPVQFIAKDSVSGSKRGPRNRIKILGDPSSVLQFRPIGNPWDTFASATVPAALNRTLWCFREGSVAKGDSDFAAEVDEKGAAHCKCKAEWHGVDCGQPEVVWRSLFAAKAAVTTQRQARNIYAILRTTGHSLETLEIQLMELIDVVDVFVVCVQHSQGGVTRVREFLENIEKLKGHSERVFLGVDKESCVPEPILRELVNSLGWRIEEDDLVLFSDQDEVYSCPMDVAISLSN